MELDKLLALNVLLDGTRQVLVMTRARCATSMGAMAIAEPAIPVLECAMQGIILPMEYACHVTSAITS